MDLVVVDQLGAAAGDDRDLLDRRVLPRTPLGQLPEQIDYSDYRDVNGVKVPFLVRYATWQNLQTEKFIDVKINAPVDDALFAKPGR